MEMIWLIQTLLDTNIQLKPNTRHAQGLPVHYGFLTMRRAAACVWVVKKDKTGEGVGEWWQEGSTMCTADVAHECFISMHFKLLKFSLLYGKIKVEPHWNTSSAGTLIKFVFFSKVQSFILFLSFSNSNVPWLLKNYETFLHHSLLSVKNLSMKCQVQIWPLHMTHFTQDEFMMISHLNNIHLFFMKVALSMWSNLLNLCLLSLTACKYQHVHWLKEQHEG